MRARGIEQPPSAGSALDERIDGVLLGHVEHLDVCESKKPSSQTSTGNITVSAILYAQRTLSNTSCADEQYSWIQPVSRWLMLSDRSGSMLHGAKTARLTLTTTSGTRSRDAR